MVAWSSLRLIGEFPNAPLYLLSFAGGGCRVLTSLYCLDRIMKRIAREKGEEGQDLRPCDFFHLIGGTSAGGIAAIMLGRLKMTVPQCIVAFPPLAKRIFRDGKRLPHHQKFRYKASYLVEAVKKILHQQGMQVDEQLFTGDQPGSDHCRTFVAALRNDRLTENSRPILFRSYPAPCSEFELQDTKIWEAIRATSAAPRVFKPITIGGIEWIDAALGFNDPGPEVLDEARKIWPGREIGAFLSLGAGERNPVENKRCYGLIRSYTNTLNAMKSITTDTQRAITYLSRELGPDILFRFSVDEGLGDIHIAEWQMLKDFEARTNKYLNKPECLERVNILVQRIISDGEAILLRIPAAAKFTDFSYAALNLPYIFKKIINGFKLHTKAVKCYKEMLSHMEGHRLFEAARSEMDCRYFFQQSEDRIADSLGIMIAEYKKTLKEKPFSEATLLEAKLKEVTCRFSALRVVNQDRVNTDARRPLFGKDWINSNPGAIYAAECIASPQGQTANTPRDHTSDVTTRPEATWQLQDYINTGFQPGDSIETAASYEAWADKGETKKVLGLV